MLNTESTFVCELSDTDLDAVAAGTGYTSVRIGQLALGNFALQFASNNQANAAFANVGSYQGGNQTNNNNAGNQR